MYRGRRLEGSGKIHLNSIFSVLNCLKEGYNDSPSFFHTIIHFNSVLKNTVLNFPVVTMNASTWMTWNSPFFLVLWLKVYDIALVNIIISEIEQVVHKMVHAVTAYPPICLKLSVFKSLLYWIMIDSKHKCNWCFVLKLDNPCRKSIRVSSTDMV